MSPVNIHGSEYPIKKVFCNDFVFTVPLYQRPYAWTTEHAGELLEDLMAFMGDGNEPVEEVDPYFLGSVVLIKGDSPDARIVDGQQRLTTLAILLSALRASLEPEFGDGLTDFLYGKAKPRTTSLSSLSSMCYLKIQPQTVCGCGGSPTKKSATNTCIAWAT